MEKQIQQASEASFAREKLEEQLENSVTKLKNMFTVDKLQKHIQHQMDAKQRELVNMMIQQIKLKMGLSFKRQIQKRIQQGRINEKLQFIDYLIQRQKAEGKLNRQIPIFDQEDYFLEQLQQALLEYQRSL